MDRDDQRPPPEHATDNDPIPEVYPDEDPRVDQEWEAAKSDPMGGESPSS